MKSFTMIAILLVAALSFTACTKKQEEPKSKISEAVPSTIQPKAEVVPEPTPAPGPAPVAPKKFVKRSPPTKVAVVETTESIDAQLEEAVNGNAPSTDTTSSEVMGPGGAPSASSEETVSTNFERSVGANITVGHVSGLRDGVRSFTEVVAEIDYKIAPATTVGVGQSARKLYDIAAVGEEEFLLDDTRVFMNHNLSKDFVSAEWDLNIAATLPTSQRSRDARHISRGTVGFTAKKRFFNDAVCVSYSPSFNYYFNQYGTDSAGNPLKRMSLAHLASLELKLMQKLGLNVWGRGYSYMYEEYNYSTATPGPSNEFSYGSYLGYDISNTFGAQLGYVWGNSMLRNTQYEDNFYDSPTGRFYAAIEVRF